MKGGTKLSDLAKYSSTELIKELATRKNQSLIKVSANQQYQVKNDQMRIKEKGPAQVLVIRGE